MKKIFKIDAALYVLGVLTLITGFIFHIVGHGNNFHVWVRCAYIHSIISISFVIMLIQHLATHAGWLKSLKNIKHRQKRSVKITCFLGLLTILVTVSGLSLLAIKGGNTPLGIWHYKLGIVFAIFVIGHAVKRFHILRKAIKNKIKA